MSEHSPQGEPGSTQRRLEWFALSGVFGAVAAYVVERILRRDQPPDPHTRG